MEPIGNFNVWEDIHNKVAFFWSMFQIRESQSTEICYLFRYTAKLNLTFLCNYRFHFFPNQLRRQLRFSRGFLTLQFIQVAWVGWHDEKSNMCRLLLSTSKPKRILLQKYRFDFFVEKLNQFSHFCMRGLHWNSLQYAPCFNILIDQKFQKKLVVRKLSRRWKLRLSVSKSLISSMKVSLEN